jgi:transposase
MDTPPPSENTRKSEFHTPQKALIRGAVNAFGDVFTNREIFRRCGVNERTGYRMLAGQTRRNRGRLSRRGRPRKISENDLKRVEDYLQGHSHYQCLSWDQLGQELGIEASGRTIKNALNQIGYCKRTACRKRWLTHQAQEIRLQYARERDHWYNEWRQVYFSDEVHFQLNKGRGVNIIRKSDERYCEDCIQYCIKAKKVNLHAWAAVGYNYKGPLTFYTGRGGGDALTQEYYRDKILQPCMEHIVKHNPHIILLEDGDGSHGNRSHDNCVRVYKDSIGLQVLKNPPSSPDLNVIENVWRILKQRIKKRIFRNEEHLKQGILEEWDKITLEEINDLVRTMKERIDEVILRRGKPTPW